MTSSDTHYPSIAHWHFLHGEPDGTARLKSEPEDFKVDEQLPFEPSGEGEHLFLRIQKKGVNTGFLAQQLAKFYQVREFDVSYAGRKDKHAVTTQWFSVWLPGKTDEQISDFSWPDCQVIERTRHNKKLRTGSVEQNHFSIVLRDCDPGDGFETRIDTIKNCGVPNYFGPQRFGNHNKEGIPGNLALAAFLLRGESIRKREKRSLAISALRSWLFNEFVSERLKQWQTEPQPGDAMSLAGSNSFFLVEAINEEIEQRLRERDIQITAPLWGKGQLATSGAIQEFETAIATMHCAMCQTLEALDLKQERRKIILHPKNLERQFENGNLILNFSLPAGCFATSVIRELLHIKS